MTTAIVGMGLIDYEVGRKFIQRHRCMCGSRIGMPWGGSYGIDGHFIRCLADLSHTEYQQNKNTRFFKDAEGQIVEYDIMTQQPVSEPVTALAVITDPKEMEQRVTKAWSSKMLAGDIYSDNLPPELKGAIIQMAIIYGLDPMLGEIAIIFKKPYATIKAVRRKHYEAGHRPSIRHRLLTEEEKTEYREAGVFEDGDLAGYAIFTREDGSTVEAFGKVTLAQRTALNRKGDGLRNPVVADNPIELLHKRQEARGWDMSYGGLGIPPAADTQSLPSGTVEGSARELDNAELEAPAPAPAQNTKPLKEAPQPQSEQSHRPAKLGNCPEHPGKAWAACPATENKGRIGHPTALGEPWCWKDEQEEPSSDTPADEAAPAGKEAPPVIDRFNLEKAAIDAGMTLKDVEAKSFDAYGSNDLNALSTERLQEILAWINNNGDDPDAPEA